MEVKIIKFFDMKHNAKSIEEYDPSFWETFRGETIRMLIALDIPDVTKHYQGFIDSL
jgi:hypothetical protein